ncbi:hypothetical protein AQUCO_04500022v1 [Aquilegia coerulea]|uniref:Nodulin-like domain-containing protein n=1 Tax=Aquilegia coerulea TaxID=218851 RepID=A0A2G5CLG2_AQUCA|nr:hypothetical protein AQUCO_04500022v1 [Aquilegia coerulea]
MDIQFWFRFRWLRARGHLENLYIIDGLAGIFGIVGSLLMDVYFTNYGMIFLSSIFYAIVSSAKLLLYPIITSFKLRDPSTYLQGLGLVTYGDNTKGGTREKLVLTGLFLSAIGKFSLRNSSDGLAEAKNEKNERRYNPFLSLMKMVFGRDTKILKFFESHEYTTQLVFVKYGTKILVIGVSTIANYRLSETPVAEKWDHVKFLIPTIGFGLVPFLSLFYMKSFAKPIEERGTPLKHVARVYIAAILKKNIPSSHSMEDLLYEENTEHPLKHTNDMRFLDKAAIIESTQPEEERRQWRLCTITEVEETKRLLHMVPMCMTFLAYGMVKSIGNTFFLQQGNYMDSTIGRLNIDLPLQTLLLLSDISSSGMKGLYVLILSNKLTGIGKKYSSPLKYGIGLVLATFCCTVAAWIAKDKGPPDTVFWLTPQYILFGAMSGITRDGIESFFHDQLPRSMMRYDSVFTDAMIGAGAMLSIVLVYATGSNLALTHLSRFYRLLTVVSFIILSVYTFVATRFRYQDNEEALSNEENQVQAVW